MRYWVPKGTQHPKPNTAQGDPVWPTGATTRLCRRVAHTWALRLTPTVCPFPNYRAPPMGRPLWVSVARLIILSHRSHNVTCSPVHSLTLSLSLCLSQLFPSSPYCHILSFSLFLYLSLFLSPSCPGRLLSSGYRGGDVGSTHPSTVRSQRGNVKRVKPLWGAGANLGDEAFVLHAA